MSRKNRKNKYFIEREGFSHDEIYGSKKWKEKQELKSIENSIRNMFNI